MKQLHRFLMFLVAQFLCIFFIVLSANEIIHYTATQGLSGTDITAICENENYIWIATNDGLCRFDGKTFKVFKKDNSSANSISENNIETMQFDSQGLLWIGFKYGGLDVYDPRKGTFIHISKLTDYYPKRVISIYEDSEKNIWLASWGEGLFQLVPNNGGKTKYHSVRHLNNLIVSSVIEFPKKQLWAGTYSGLYTYSPNTKKWSIVNNKFVVSQLLKNKDNKSVLCSTWYEGIMKISPQTNKPPLISSICAKNTEVYRMYPETEDQMYIGTWGDGLKIYNFKTKSLHTFDNQLKPLVILSMMKDSYGNLWVGTYGNGLFKITTLNRGIQSYLPINQSGYAAVYALKSIADNHVIIGSEGEGLYHYDLLKSSLVKKDNGLYKGGQNNFILTIYKDNDLVIIGHDDFGVYLAPINAPNAIDVKYKVIKSNREFAKVTYIFRSNDGLFWFGTKQNGLISAHYNKQGETLTNFSYYDINTGQITGISQFDNQRLLIASHNGLFLFNIQTKKIENEKKPLLSEMVYSMLTDSKNKCIWLGTSVGLRKLTLNSKNELEIPFLGLLPQGAINDLIIDDYNNLWFSIGSRVFCILYKSKKIKEINLGEYGNQLFLSSTNTRINGKNCILFGGEKSLVSINPLIALNQHDESKIVFTELQIDHSKVNVGEKIYGKIILEKQTEYINKIRFSYKCKWVSLSFTQVGWNNFINHYQYKIDGFSQNWQFLDIDKPIIFSQLQPGEYKLVIKRLDADENENPLWNLDIIVTPPWYKTNWFYFSLLLAFLILAFFAYKFITKRLKQREEKHVLEMEKKKKEEVLLEKESFFAGLSHDLLTPFSLIVAPSGDLMKSDELSYDNKEKAGIINKNAKYLSDVFKTILDFKRIETIDITLEERSIEIVSFVKVIVDSFRYLAKSKHIDFQFTTDIDSLTVSMDIVKFERILFNLLSNAFKFTNENGRIALNLSYSNDEISLTLNDNGVGIETDKLQMIYDKFYQNNKAGATQGFGLGLYIVKKFIDIMKGTIQITSKPNAGTKVMMSIPAKKVSEEVSDDNSKDLFVETENPENEISILLVEDNEEMRNYLKKQLSSYFCVATAANGVEAFDFIQSFLPEIVISDIMMPEMDGLTLCSQIKQSQVFSDIFVVLISAKSSPEDELIGYKAGADFYIAKPFDSEIFVKQILNINATRIQRRKQILANLLNPKQDGAHTTPKDDFLQKAMRIIDKNISDENFKIDDFASQMNISKTVLHRKFRLLIGESPNTFIRHIRLNRASELLINSNLTVAEIAYLTGFHQSQYFIKCFKEEFGVTPKYYREQKIH